MLYLSSVQFGHKSNVNQPKTQIKQDKNARRARKYPCHTPFAPASRRDTRHRQKANAAKAIAPPTYPTDAMERCVQAAPPTHVPHPMPKLNMPEKMDMDTAVASCGECAIISLCKDTLNAVATMPHRAHSDTTAGTSSDARK